MSVLRKETITIENLYFLYGELKKTSKIVLSENRNFIYTPIIFGGYGFRINDKNEIEFGCQKPTVETIKNVLRDLKGEKTLSEEWYFDKDIDKKIIKVSDVFETTSTFFIDSSGKTFKKPENFGIKHFEDNTRYIIQKRDYHTNNCVLKWCWNGYFIGSDTNDIIQKLEYILETYKTYNELKNK